MKTLTETQLPIAQRVFGAYYGGEVTLDETQSEFDRLHAKQALRQCDEEDDKLLKVLAIKLGQAAFLP